MANYSTDLDLVEIIPTIMNMGDSSYTVFHTQAKDDVDRILRAQWYPNEAADRGIDTSTTYFDADNLDAAELQKLSAYKALELIFRSKVKPGPASDMYEKLMLLYRDYFTKELDALMKGGISYDWDEDGTIDEDEQYSPRKRRLKRT